MPSQVNKEGDAREGMDIEQDSDVELKIMKPTPPKNAKPWEQKNQAEEDAGKRIVLIQKNRDGPKLDSFPVRLVGQYFRFETLPR